MADYSVVEVLREEPARVTIRGLRRSFYPPSHLPPVDNSPPEKKLQLEWVYGYRGTDTRKNLWVLPSGELLYYVAAVAILFDREENAQRHYIGHTEDIMCMEVGSGFRSIMRGAKCKMKIESLQVSRVPGVAYFYHIWFSVRIKETSSFY